MLTFHYLIILHPGLTSLLPTKGTKPAGTQPSTGLLFQAPPHVSFLWSRCAKQSGTHHTVALRTACPTLLITRLPQVLVTEPQSLPGVLIH